MKLKNNTKKALIATLGVLLITVPGILLAAENALVVPINRSVLVETDDKMVEVAVADPNIADVVTHGDSKMSVLGKKAGKTNIRIFGAAHKVLREFDVLVSYDLPAIRKTLGNFFPDEKIGIEIINDKIALTGVVADAEVAAKAASIASQFVVAPPGGAAAAPSGSGAAPAQSGGSSVMNLLQVKSGQQVMLRVRIGEIQRSALRKLGVSLEAVMARGNFGIGTSSGQRSDLTGSGPGGLNTPFTRSDQNLFATGWRSSSISLAATLDALETNGLFKVLAEPNLVAISGEKAEFLAGGEFPVPVASSVTGGSGSQVTIEFKPFGVAVQFMPIVLSQDKIRLMVQPEVSELSKDGSIQVSGFSIPTVNSRRVKTTVELAPGESVMIAGLIKDQSNSTNSSTPGVSEIPILSSLFRSTSYERTETELVISVTPYIVDPVVSSDIKLPTDNFKPASVLESFFYGSLSSLSGDALTKSQRPQLEGPVGFMLD